MVVCASVMLLVIGCFNLVYGIAAVADAHVSAILSTSTRRTRARVRPRRVMAAIAARWAGPTGSR